MLLVSLWRPTRELPSAEPNCPLHLVCLQVELIDGVSLHKGVPDQEAGHAANVTSYFDRFWEHGNKRERYFIFVTKA